MIASGGAVSAGAAAGWPHRHAQPAGLRLSRHPGQGRPAVHRMEGLQRFGDPHTTVHMMAADDAGPHCGCTRMHMSDRTVKLLSSNALTWCSARCNVRAAAAGLPATGPAAVAGHAPEQARRIRPLLQGARACVRQSAKNCHLRLHSNCNQSDMRKSPPTDCPRPSIWRACVFCRI